MIITAKILSDRKLSKADFNISVSKAKTFTDCKAKYKYCYIEKQPRKEWEHHKFGKFLHEIFENFYNVKKNEPKLNINTLADEFYIKSLPNYTLTEEAKTEALGILKAYITNYNEQKIKKTLPNVIGMEQPFNIDIDGKILLNGIIDRVQIDYDGVIHVADYKTTKEKRYLKNDYFQLLTYAFALMLEDKSLETIRTSYILLRHNCEFMTKEFSRNDVMEVEGKFKEYVENIYAEKLWRANPTPLCGYCDYLELCSDGTAFMKAWKRKKEAKNKQPVKFGLTEW